MRFQMNSPAGKAILARARGGDYAHPGEEEALRLVADGIERAGIARVLDVGCGRGGTAAWFHRHGWGHVTGVDIDGESITHARVAYPEVEFAVADAGNLEAWRTAPFDLAYLFNSLYAFPDQPGALRAIRSVCRRRAPLRIFDYARARDATLPAALGEEMGNPVVIEDMPDWLATAGWQPAGIEDFTERYAGWYRALLASFDREREWIVGNFGEDWRRYVVGWYGALHDALDRRILRGMLFKAVAV